MNTGNGNDRSRPRLSDLDQFAIEVENIGGIESTDVSLSRGVTIFTGRNATNRTSLLRAIAGAIGGDAGILKRDADEGSVTLTVHDDQYVRRYVRRNETVITEGEPYVDEADSDLIDLFACLLEDNPIRRAVRAGDDLKELLLRPIDTDEIESEITDLRAERNRIDERLTEIERERKRLSKLEEKRTRLWTELDTVESDLTEVREQVVSLDPDAAASEEAESLLAEFKQLQEALEEAESEIRTQQSIREDLQENLADVQEELARLTVQEDDLADIKREIDRLQTRESELSTTINELSTILAQNEDLLAGEEAALAELTVEDDAMDKLDPMGQSVECWTCGSRVERRVIANHLKDIEGLVDRKRDERKQVREELSELRSRHRTVKRNEQQIEDLRERKNELETELDRRSEEIEELRSETESLRTEIAELESAFESTDDLSDEHDQYERLSELEYERGRLESEIDSVETEIEEIEYLVGKQDDLEAERESLTDRITSLRSHVEQIQKEVVEQFNTHAAAVLERLEYENIERVWIERRGEGDESMFELHIVREDESGTVYEDSVDHLSESEREVVGLVVALAGYLVYDVHETVPVMLLDSLETIDAPRIAELVDYFSAHVDYLLLALLEEDATELPDSYERVPAESVLV